MKRDLDPQPEAHKAVKARKSILLEDGGRLFIYNTGIGPANSFNGFRLNVVYEQPTRVEVKSKGHDILHAPGFITGGIFTALGLTNVLIHPTSVLSWIILIVGPILICWAVWDIGGVRKREEESEW